MAVFTEQELMQEPDLSVDAILENALYLESGASTITPKTVAVTENKAIQAMVVRFGDIAALSEEYGCSYLDAMSAVVEANELDPKTFAVAVDEAEIIENPELMNELANVVINPQSENSFAYQFCEAMVDAWTETEEEGFLEAMVDDDVAMQALDIMDEAAFEVMNEFTDVDGSSITKDQLLAKYGTLGAYKAAKNKLRNADTGMNAERAFSNFSPTKKSIAGINATKRSQSDALNAAKEAKYRRTQSYASDGFKRTKAELNKPGLFQRGKNAIMNNKGKVAAGLGVAAAAAGGAALLKKFGRSNAVGQAQDVLKQAAGKDKNWIGKKIASLRSLYQKWLSKANAEKDAGRASAFKRVAASIMNVIDALMKKLQGSVGTIGK